MLPTRFRAAGPAWLLLAVLIQPGVGGAGDGVLEISQACALGGGCFPGDAPGFPVQIQAPGSYRLTTNLDLVYGPAPDLDTVAILIGADDVTIDLAGFAILGPTRCPEPWTFPTTCPPPQAGVARGIDGLPRRRSSVHGGTVRGFPADGVILGDLARVHDLRVSQVGGQGIQVGQASIVARGQVSYTRGRAFEVGPRSVVVSSSAEWTVGFGVSVYDDTVVSRCELNRTESDAVDGLSAVVLRGNAVTLTKGIGLDAGPDSVVVGNAVNLVTGAGIRLGPGAGFGENAIGSALGGGPAAASALACNTVIGVRTCPP